MENLISTILIVDDDEVFTAVLARSLEKRGYRALTASNHEKALEQARLHSPDEAILDLKLVGESGLALIPQLKALLPDLNILILTGYSSVSTAVEAIKLGAINYLCKPANTDEILAALEYRDGDSEAPLAATPPTVARLEWEHIQRVLQENNGNISATARALSMHRRTLQRKLDKRPVSE
jgi:two-component system, response regulator RegA